MTTTTGSTVPRRMLGRLLKQYRIAADVSQAKAARELQVGAQTIWRMETGQNVILKKVYIDALCKLYRLKGEEAKRIRQLHQEAEEASHITWWHQYDEQIPPHFDLYMQLEDAAQSFSAYHPSLLPGLLQTPEYRRQIIWTEFPAMATVEVERRIELHTKRVERLTSTKHPIRVSVLVDEAVLRRPAGPPEVMSDQLEHLVEADKLPNVTVRVVPFSVGMHVGTITGPFVLLDFPPHATAELTEPPTVYIQGFTGAAYLDTADKVAPYRTAYAEIQRTALDEKASHRLILDIAEELTR
ncbi:helix-turn-helix domain-containing protein [Nocardia niwae]|uniref:helix-turn-helix domain-containing protein n=1 Tax=Nocardia niwae TaxID=626084 RepID=UPI0007C7754B|nr:helix-turn-helix transcriptional regulator [Nocardia niwae]